MEMNSERPGDTKRSEWQLRRPFSAYNPPGTSQADLRERCRDQALPEFGFYYNRRGSSWRVLGGGGPALIYVGEDGMIQEAEHRNGL